MGWTCRDIAKCVVNMKIAWDLVELSSTNLSLTLDGDLLLGPLIVEDCFSNASIGLFYETRGVCRALVRGAQTMCLFHKHFFMIYRTNDKI